MATIEGRAPMHGRPDSARWRGAVVLLCLAVPSGCGEQRDPGVGGSASGGSGGNAGAVVCELSSEGFAWPDGENTPVPAHESWKPVVEVPTDSFFSSPRGDSVEGMAWIKFIVLASDPEQIYFQDSTAAPFHYEFASRHVPIFQDMTRAEFAAVSLGNEGRLAVLGALVMPVDRDAFPEYGVQIVSNDDVHPALVERVMQTVAAHVSAPAGTAAIYLPSGRAAECVDSKRDDLTARGVSFGSIDRWLRGDGCYSTGWAAGRLTQLPAAEIEAAYIDGRLTPNDILLIEDTAPAELPFVAGILTLEPSTPNAHSAVLASSFGVPFVYLRQPETRALASTLQGQHVIVSTFPARGRYELAFTDGTANCAVRLMPADNLSADEIAEIHRLGAPPALAVAVKQPSAALARTVDGLGPADIVYVGGKAANFGVLRSAAPEVTPNPAIALSFDLWDAFLDSPVPGASTSLRAEIAARLAGHAWPPDMRELDSTLRGVRDLIKDVPFPTALRDGVLTALAPFEPNTRIRFRSSTNVEDSETFTGAGLYDSATGCLADDLDPDDVGPSLCNPDELDEHGVFRAIQRVYSSFYFLNAYVERLRRGVNEAEVGMGVLVHHSVPDPEELANGVATTRYSDRIQSASLATQWGATSVTNPDGSALPELVSISSFDATEYTVSTQQNSSLLPLGAHVLAYAEEYETLMMFFNRVGAEYARVTGKALPLSLDFEYKKVAPGQLSLRQVRPLPPPDTALDVTPFLVGATATFCTYGSENADAFATHRLKARIGLEGRSGVVTPEQLGTSLYDRANVEFVDAGSVRAVDGSFAALPGATHRAQFEEGQATTFDEWDAGGARWALSTRLRAKSSRYEGPVLTFDDLLLDLAATWATPQPILEHSDVGSLVPGTRSEDSVELWGYCSEAIEIQASFPRVEQAFTSGSVTVETSYWYPPAPTGPSGGYTAPIIRWDATTITGLTTAPIVLTGYYSQTHAPKHHNFGGEYIFEPRLEPGLPEATRLELEAANVASIVIIDFDSQGAEDEIWVLGVDGALRAL
jgi:hypothetical protein